MPQNSQTDFDWTYWAALIASLTITGFLFFSLALSESNNPGPTIIWGYTAWLIYKKEYLKLLFVQKLMIALCGICWLLSFIDSQVDFLTFGLTSRELRSTAIISFAIHYILYRVFEARTEQLAEINDQFEDIDEDQNKVKRERELREKHPAFADDQNKVKRERERREKHPAFADEYDEIKRQEALLSAEQSEKERLRVIEDARRAAEEAEKRRELRTKEPKERTKLQKREAEIKRAEEQLEKAILAAKGKTICTLKESIDITKIVLSKEDQASLLGRIDFLEGSGELEIFLKSVNDDLRSEYESEVRLMYQREQKQFPHCNHPKIIEMHSEADVTKCMELGLNNLFKTHIGSGQPTKDAINRQKAERKQKK